MGSGKSTLAQNLKDVLGGRIIAQDEFTNVGKDARRLCFVQEVEAAANNREVEVLIMDRVNTLQQQRTELAEALKNRCLPGKTVLIQMRHPEHRGQLAGDLAVQLCMERTTHRGSNHNSLLGTRQNLKAILSCTSRHAELPDLAESNTFDQRSMVCWWRRSSSILGSHCCAQGITSSPSRLPVLEGVVDPGTCNRLMQTHVLLPLERFLKMELLFEWNLGARYLGVWTMLSIWPRCRLRLTTSTRNMT